jgi:hypothetical protein
MTAAAVSKLTKDSQLCAAAAASAAQHGNQLTNDEAARLAAAHNVGLSTVRRVWTRGQAGELLPRAKPGRPPVIGDVAANLLAEAQRAGAYMETNAQMSAYLAAYGVHASVSTVHRFIVRELREGRWKKRSVHTRPFLTASLYFFQLVFFSVFYIPAPSHRLGGQPPRAHRVLCRAPS